MTALDLPEGLRESLPGLRQQLDIAKREVAAATQRVRDLTDLITTIERVSTGRSSASLGPAILVMEGQFRGLSVSEAVKRVMYAHQRAFRASELVDVLSRGGDWADTGKLRQNVAAAMKYLRSNRMLEKGQADQSWQLTPEARIHLAATASEPPSELFASGQRG